MEKLLLINPIVKPANYQFYFNVGRKAATKYHRADLDAAGKRVLTFHDFYKLYGGFPDPSFKAQWKLQPVP